MKFCGFKRFYYLIHLAVLLSLTTLLTACGGGGEHDNSVDKNPPLHSWWSGYHSNESALVSGDQVAQWIENGFKTEDGAKVIIFDTMTNFTGADDRIVGSIAASFIQDFNINENRFEGPIDPTHYNNGAGHNSSSSNSITGARVDAILQDLGVKHDTVLVIAGSGASQWKVWRFYWELTYFGLSKANIKVLDGGVAAVKTADPDLVNTTYASYDPIDSTFSIKDLPGMKPAKRASMKYVIDAVRSDKAVIFSQTGAAASRLIKTTDSFFLAAASVTNAGKFKTAEELQELIIDNINASYLEDGKEKIVSSWEEVLQIFKNKKIIVHCVSGSSASALYVAFTDVLGIDVALYDGSANQWNSYKAGPADSVEQKEMDFQSLLGIYNTSLYSFDSAAGTLIDLFTHPQIIVESPYFGTGNEIYEADYEYTNTKPSGSGGHEGLEDGGASGSC